MFPWASSVVKGPYDWTMRLCSLFISTFIIVIIHAILPRSLQLILEAYLAVLNEKGLNKCDLVNPEASPRQHFNFLAFCLEESKPRAQRVIRVRHSPDIRYKLVCHSLVIFTIRLNLPGQSHHNPIGPLPPQKGKHASLGFMLGEWGFNRMHSQGGW